MQLIWTWGESKFFFNLEKYWATHNTIKKCDSWCSGNNWPSKNKQPFFSFYKKLFEERLQNDSKKLLELLKDIPIPSLTEEQKKICEDELMEKEIYQFLISMENNKSPGNDGLRKEFYCTFWN